MRPMHQAVWAQLRGKQIVPERTLSPSIEDEKLEADVEQVERPRTP